MIPNMYKISGELLPAVFTFPQGRACGTRAFHLRRPCRRNGCAPDRFAMLAAASVQETMDMAAVAHLSTLKAKVPFVHFFGRLQDVPRSFQNQALDYDKLAEMVDWKSDRGVPRTWHEPGSSAPAGYGAEPGYLLPEQGSCKQVLRGDAGNRSETMNEFAESVRPPVSPV